MRNFKIWNFKKMTAEEEKEFEEELSKGMEALDEGIKTLDDSMKFLNKSMKNLDNETKFKDENCRNYNFSTFKDFGDFIKNFVFYLKDKEKDFYQNNDKNNSSNTVVEDLKNKKVYFGKDKSENLGKTTQKSSFDLSDENKKEFESEILDVIKEFEKDVLTILEKIENFQNESKDYMIELNNKLLILKEMANEKIDLLIKIQNLQKYFKNIDKKLEKFSNRIDYFEDKVENFHDVLKIQVDNLKDLENEIEETITED